MELLSYKQQISLNSLEEDNISRQLSKRKSAMGLSPSKWKSYWPNSERNDFKEDFVNAILPLVRVWRRLGYHGLAGAGTELVLFLAHSLWIKPQSAEEQRLFKYACLALPLQKQWFIGINDVISYSFWLIVISQSQVLCIASLFQHPKWYKLK